MIRKRIQHIFKTFNNIPTIYDYIKEPDITIKKSAVCDANYAARPVFNSLKVVKGKKATNSLSEYRKYKMKHSKSRIRNVDKINKNKG